MRCQPALEKLCSVGNPSRPLLSAGTTSSAVLARPGIRSTDSTGPRRGEVGWRPSKPVTVYSPGAVPASSCQGQRTKYKGQWGRRKEKWRSPVIRHFHFPLCSCPLYYKRTGSSSPRRYLSSALLSRGILTLDFEKRDEGYRDRGIKRRQLVALSLCPFIPLSLICLTCASDARCGLFGHRSRSPGCRR